MRITNCLLCNSAIEKCSDLESIEYCKCCYNKDILIEYRYKYNGELFSIWMRTDRLLEIYYQNNKFIYAERYVSSFEEKDMKNFSEYKKQLFKAVKIFELLM